MFVIICSRPTAPQPTICTCTQSYLLNIKLTSGRGAPGEEAADYGYKMTNSRRRSNSSTFQGLEGFKTKFEHIDADPVFEEELHGPLAEDDESSAAESTSTAEEGDEGTDSGHAGLVHDKA